MIKNFRVVQNQRNVKQEAATAVYSSNPMRIVCIYFAQLLKLYIVLLQFSMDGKNIPFLYYISLSKESNENEYLS